MYYIICTSYTETKHGLVLRNNWAKQVFCDSALLELIDRWMLPDDFKYPSKNSISEILEGKMDLDNVVIHVRIVSF